MIAMILAAGRGQRMMPLTKDIPKPLIRVNDKPLIVYTIEKLKKAGFKTLVVNLGYLGNVLKEYLESKDLGIKIIFSDEQDSGALESAGGIKKALPFLGEKFLVVNADIWCDYEFDIDFELGEDLAHLVLVKNPDHNLKGDFGISKNNKLLNSAKSMFTFSGIGYYSAKLFDHIDDGKYPLAPLLRENIDKISCVLHSTQWKDIGTPKRLEELNFSF